MLGYLLGMVLLFGPPLLILLAGLIWGPHGILGIILLLGLVAFSFPAYELGNDLLKQLRRR